MLGATKQAKMWAGFGHRSKQLLRKLGALLRRGDALRYCDGLRLSYARGAKFGSEFGCRATTGKLRAQSLRVSPLRVISCLGFQKEGSACEVLMRSTAPKGLSREARVFLKWRSLLSPGFGRARAEVRSDPYHAAPARFPSELGCTSGILRVWVAELGCE